MCIHELQKQIQQAQDHKEKTRNQARYLRWAEEALEEGDVFNCKFYFDRYKNNYDDGLDFEGDCINYDTKTGYYVS